jgi:hypothetical protein
MLDTMEEKTTENIAASLPSPDQIETAGVNVTERDIVFDCPNCKGELIIDMEGAGMDVKCALCGAPVKVPDYHGASLQFLQAATAKLAKAVHAARTASPRQFQFAGKTPEELRQRQTELERILRDNQAQGTEVKGHIHHATIQLHRYRLKLEVLQERQVELKAERDALAEILKTL